MPRVFLITGTSTAFGHDYAQEVLDRGDIVAATARDPSQLSFTNTGPETTLKKFGRIDVVVNNAGYGLSGCFEECIDEEIRRQTDINFFGLLDVTGEALETMRDKQRPQGGLIQQITSIGGQRGVPFFNIYCASKWAVEGFTEALSHELKPGWGIKLTLIEPGGFRTDWAGRSMTFAKSHPAYDHLNAEIHMTARHSTQAGDPKKGAKAMYELAVMPSPPLRVVVGIDAYKAVMNKQEQYEQNYTKYAALSNSTDVDGCVASQ
ncbi:uncharacterized protein Z519_04371 [Cladophialophora bantiana CBS 173.52]|uniref:NAD(P)-binding protein n=1 Tax=Cladophialophora bantiana (strain ATCC 10958 / CBS 173.52 / CDC B-1940 / NIH 8579) TaxID=1442370 RepID=A0A0D2HU43_CLAB1|nr:uncharacterized protein Z519_04371 [Cladophialophora bantiana CBS 173.52]KIW94395.1 hypothetical protein Z519_04371 [Cladophialophora bantiana CBS 173.52]